MQFLPTLDEVKQLSSGGQYKVVPISCEILSDICTPIEALKILKNISTHCYHSLAAADLPGCLKVTAVTADGEIMAVSHTDYPIYGVQFHPESILTPLGRTMLNNFISM